MCQSPPKNGVSWGGGGGGGGLAPLGEHWETVLPRFHVRPPVHWKCVGYSLVSFTYLMYSLLAASSVLCTCDSLQCV